MSTASEGIRVTDLANPAFPDFIADAIKGLAGTSVDYSVDRILDEARAQSGLDSFGEEDFIERLQVIAGAMESDKDISPLGHQTNYSYLVRHAAQRARLEQLYKDHPEIDNEEIVRPIIIAGLPRSGTTHMLNLIGTDPRLRSLPYWESLEPFPAPDEIVSAGQEDPRIQRCRDQLAMQDQILPLFKNMHEMYPEHIHEEVELQYLDFSSMLYENFGLLHEFRDYYTSHDQTPHYAYLKKAMKALQWLRGPRRWIMKSPQHMEQLVPLNTIFPDATFVLPHRDPVSVTSSLLTMLCYTARMSRDPVKPAEIGAYWIDRVHRMLSACVRDYDQLPAAQTENVLFHEFMKDDIATIERIYNSAGHVMTPDIRAGMENYMTANPRGKYGRIIYDIERDFGVSRDALYEQFSFYTDKFPVRIENQG